MKRQKIALDQVYDLLALRIITDSVKNCYAALGVIHNEWHPFPGRIKDFIAIPRPEPVPVPAHLGDGAGRASFEVQIRTEEMHRLAEEGIAAHWKYKEGKRRLGEDDQRMAWLRQLVEWQQEMHDPARVHVHAESGPVPGRSLHLHSAREGDHAAARRHAHRFRLRHPHRHGQHLRGRQGQRPHRPAASYPLRNGDVVEILTQTAATCPARTGWRCVKTSRARNKIKHVINTTERAKAIEIGEKYLEREARRLGVQLLKITRSADLERVAGDYGSARSKISRGARLRQVFRAAGLAETGAGAGRSRSLPRPTANPDAFRARDAAGQDDTADLVIKVKGIDDLLVYRAKCCNPIRGEAIVGYVTRGKGVAVHSANCTERPEPDVRGGAQDRRRMGARRLEASRCELWSTPKTARDPESNHSGAVQRTKQHPQPGGDAADDDRPGMAR